MNTPPNGLAFVRLAKNCALVENNVGPPQKLDQLDHLVLSGSVQADFQTANLFFKGLARPSPDVLPLCSSPSPDSPHMSNGDIPVPTSPRSHPTPLSATQSRLPWPSSVSGCRESAGKSRKPNPGRQARGQEPKREDQRAESRKDRPIVTGWKRTKQKCRRGSLALCPALQDVMETSALALHVRFTEAWSQTVKTLRRAEPHRERSHVCGVQCFYFPKKKVRPPH